MSTTIPHRFSERSFRRYESDIAQISAAYPGLITLSPGDLSIETYTHRLRDAIRGVLEYHYPTTIDLAKLAKQDICVRVVHGEIQAGSRKELAKALSRQQTALPSIVENITAPDEETLKALCLLMSKRMHGPTRLSGVPLDMLHRLEGEYDISFVENEDGSVTLL